MLNRIVPPTGDDTIDGLLSGLKWGSDTAGNGITLTYSFPDNNSTFTYNDYNTGYWYGLNSAQQNAFRTVLASWSAVANINFQEVTDSGNSYGEIRITYSWDIDFATDGLTFILSNGSYSGSSHYDSDEIAGDIWLHPVTRDTESGSYDVHVISHELGHALGLKHPFEQDWEFNMPALPSYLDDVGYTLMSYTDWDGAGYRYTDDGDGGYREEIIYPTTPMVYDIQAIQHLYGANMNTGAGNDTYRFKTQGEYMTVWDAGGVDTIDLSNQQVWASLDLTPGTVSSVGQRQTSSDGPLDDALYNIGIAFDTWIENAIGSVHNDSIYGNAIDNRLTGGAGDDYLSGGDGEDTAVYSGHISQYQITQDEYFTYVSGSEGTDTLLGIEKLSFNGETVSLQAALTTTASSSAAPSTRQAVNMTPDESDAAWFLLELSTPLSTDAQVNYSTRDGTAIAGQDYEATTGVARIEAGETHVAIQVNLIDDQITEGNETFSLVVTDPVGGTFGDGIVELTATRTIIDNDFA